MNDAEFVDGLRKQNPEAIRHLTQCYLSSVWRFVYLRVNGDRHLAEDIVSEAVLALIRAAADDAEIRNPAAWLRSVANHKVQDHFRAVARVQHLLDQAKQTVETADHEDPVKKTELQEKRASVREAMDRLPEQHRLVLEWKYLDKLSVRQIAERLGVSEKAAESILYRARRDFRTQMVNEEDSPAESTAPPGCSRNGSADDQDERVTDHATNVRLPVTVRHTERSR